MRDYLWDLLTGIGDRCESFRIQLYPFRWVGRFLWFLADQVISPEEIDAEHRAYVDSLNLPPYVPPIPKSAERVFWEKFVQYTSEIKKSEHTK